MHILESILKNEMHKILWDFETQTDYLISAEKPDLALINKKKGTCHQVDFAIPVNHWVKKKRMWKDRQYLDLANKLKKLWDIRVTVILIIIGVLGTVPKDMEERKTGGIGNQRKNQDHLDHSIF